MSPAIADNRGNACLKIFQKRKVAVGVVHCLPLPGSPRFAGMSVETIYDQALRDAEAYVSGGIDGLIIENHGDIPFLKPSEIGPETSSTMAVITDRVRREFGVPLGVNILANAAIQALAVAKAAGAAFVRVNQWANAYVANEGLIEGEAARALRFRSAIGAKEVMIFADAHVKHGAHAIVADRSVTEFFDADAVIATGRRTGDAADLSELEEIAHATRLPVFVGSGVTTDNVSEILRRAEGVIIGSSLKTDGVWWGAVDTQRVAAFMKKVIELRASLTA
jgi:uncharacterized protein